MREDSATPFQPGDIRSVAGDFTAEFFRIPDEGLARLTKALLWDLLAEELPLGNWHMKILPDRIFMITLKETVVEPKEDERNLFSLFRSFVTCRSLQAVSDRRFDIFSSRKRSITEELREKMRRHIMNVLEYIDRSTGGKLLELTSWKNCRVELIEGPQDAGFDFQTSGGRFFLGIKSGTLWMNQGSFTVEGRKLSTSQLVKMSWRGAFKEELARGLASAMDEVMKSAPCWDSAYKGKLDAVASSYFDLDISTAFVKGQKGEYLWEMKVLEPVVDEEHPEGGSPVLKFVDNQGREAWDEAAIRHLSMMLERFNQLPI